MVWVGRSGRGLPRRRAEREIRVSIATDMWSEHPGDREPSDWQRGDSYVPD